MNILGWLFVLALIVFGGGWELIQQPGTLLALAVLVLAVLVCR
jgi:hypothetical protein